MKKLLIILILFMFSFSFNVTGEEFPDGKYFAYIKDSNYLKWEIIVLKEKNILKVEFLEVKKGMFDYEGLRVFVRKKELTNQLSDLEINDSLKYDFGLINFHPTLEVHIFGTLGKLSKLNWQHSSYIHSVNFKYIPYKFYNSFKDKLSENRNLTTETFEFKK